LGLLALVAISTLPAVAQSAGFPRFEAGGGFLYRNFGTPFQPNANEVGWFGTATYNFKNWLGLDADIEGGYTHPFHVDTRQYTFLFGPQIYPLGHHKLTPFAKALFGVSHFSFPDILDNSGGRYTDNGLDMSLGAGVDWNLMHHVALRLGEIDYEYTRNFDPNLDNPKQHSFKAKVGVIVRF